MFGRFSPEEGRATRGHHSFGYSVCSADVRAGNEMIRLGLSWMWRSNVKPHTGLTQTAYRGGENYITFPDACLLCVVSCVKMESGLTLKKKEVI